MNQTDEICHFMSDNTIDISVITTTWLTDNHRDGLSTNHGYDFTHMARTRGKGGGVGIPFRKEQ